VLARWPVKEHINQSHGTPFGALRRGDEMTAETDALIARRESAVLKWRRAPATLSAAR
jgi:hypothetical protein